jgi:hypothetical protein
MADDNILSEALGAVTGGGNIEQTLIQDAENMIQQKTGFDVASLLGGGNSQQAAPAQDSSDDSSNQ